MKQIFKKAFRDVALAGSIAGLGAAPLLAQDDARFSLELNNAAQTDAGGCRLTYVATNQSDLGLNQTAYQVGVFDAGGVVRRILVLEFGALTAGKTRIVLFDLADQPCTDISRIIVNTVAECTLADGQASDFCLTGLATSSRTDIQFGL
jgi:hypothetical protein